MGSATCCAQCFRLLFTAINGIFLLIGLTLVAVGIYSVIESSSYEFISGSRYASGGIVLIVAGLVTAVIAGLGAFGACMKWRPLLVAYIIILTLIVLVDIISGVIALLYKDKVYETSESQFQEGWERAIKDYGTDSDATRTVDSLQRNLECCGSDNYTDWLDRDTDDGVPPSCNCSKVGDNCIMIQYTLNETMVQQNVYKSGCVDATLDMAQKVAYVIGGVGVAFGLFEIIGIIIAIALVIWITKSKSDGYQVV